jgi:hypothetical protein
MKTYILFAVVLSTAMFSALRAEETDKIGLGNEAGIAPVQSGPANDLKKPQASPMLAAEEDALRALEERKALITRQAAGVRGAPNMKLIPDLEHKVWIVSGN